jgi:hypothetical protein
LGRQSQQIFYQSWRILQGGLRDEAEHGDQHAAAAEQSQHAHQASQPRQIQVSQLLLKFNIKYLSQKLLYIRG